MKDYRGEAIRENIDVSVELGKEFFRSGSNIFTYSHMNGELPDDMSLNLFKDMELSSKKLIINSF